MFGAHHALAQEVNTHAPPALPAPSTNIVTALNPLVALPPLDLFSVPEHTVTLTADSASRPRGLVPLYVSFASLQALDLASTRLALDRGAHETNPVVATLTRSTPALLGMKAGATAAIIYLTERLRKRHPVGAVLLMTGLNAGYVAIVAHNFRGRWRG
jgi:hypothetical protein